MPISLQEFNIKTDIELDLRTSKVRVWLLKFLSENNNSAYTLRELTDLCPKENFKAKIDNKEASIGSAMTKLITGGLVKRKGSYYIRTEAVAKEEIRKKRKYTKHKKEE